MRQTTYLLVLFLLILTACKTDKSSSASNVTDSVALSTAKNQKDTLQKALSDTLSTFPKVEDITTYKETTVIPTLEHALLSNKNAIYSASFLYAWEAFMGEIKKEKMSSLSSISASAPYDLVLVNKSKSYLKTLENKEYTTEIINNEGKIFVKASFEKSLPFEIKLKRMDNVLIFKGIKVAAFGLLGEDLEMHKIVKILYYKDDNNFIISLLPKDEKHQIILYKSSAVYPTMMAATQDLNQKIALGEKERLVQNTAWRYYIEEKDEIIIPRMKFNIKNIYTTISDFTPEDDSYYQRTAFILDENGAKIESEAVIQYAKDEDAVAVEKPKPKKMIFDKPFLLLLKRVDNVNPYFGLWTTNTELMQKE